MIEVTLLGTPGVTRDGQPVAFDTRKALALLAYLALADRPRARDVLSGLLWPEQDIDHARGALRRTLSTLRGAIGAAGIEATRDHVRLAPGAVIEVDVHRFRALAAGGDLPAAVEAFRGDFLEGLVIGGAPDFEHWQDAQAQSLRRELGSVLGTLAAARESAGDLPGALAVARRWLALDELHEPAHRALIRLSALNGDRAGALTMYRDCVRTLSRELGVPPLRETTLLYEAISQGVLAAPAAPAGPVRQPEPNPAPFVGRDGALQSLLAIHRDSAEHGRVVVIEGEAGIGKTRLAEEFLARARRRGAVTLVGRAFEEEAALTYAPLIEALRARLREDDRWVESVPAGALRQAARLVPELSNLAIQPEADPSDPGAAEGFFAGVWETLVVAAAGACPGVLLVDDAQWADEASRRLLAYGLRRFADRRLLVLLTWRTPYDHPLRRLVAELERAGNGSVVGLGRLSGSDVDDLLQAARPDMASAGVRDRLHAQTEGLPFLIVEYLRAVDSGAEEGWSLPSGARDLMLSRLDPVSDTGRQILSAAAVLGRSFDVATVLTTSGRAEEETVAALEELTQRGLIREGTADYDFSHDTMRAVVYAETSLARRRLLHARAALAPLASAAVARHLHLAGRDEAAADAYARAAAQARSLFAHAEALEQLRAALALGHPDPVAIHADIAEIQTLQGDYSGAVTSYETAAATASRDRLGAIEARLGQVHHRRGDWALARAHLLAALDAAAEDDHAGRARITADLSLTEHSAGDHAQAAELARGSHEIALRAGDLPALGQAANLLGLLAASRGDTEEALTHLRASLTLAERAEDAGARVAALNNLALVHRSNGELDAALDLTRDAVTLCAALGDRHREAALHNNLADLLHTSGQPEDAMQQLKLAVSIFAEIGADEEHQAEIWKLVRW